MQGHRLSTGVSQGHGLSAIKNQGHHLSTVVSRAHRVSTDEISAPTFYALTTMRASFDRIVVNRLSFEGCPV